MLLSRETGAQIAQEIKACVGCDVNLMDPSGCIVASTNPNRVGQLHPIAQEIVRSNLEEIEVLRQDDNMLEGINLPIHLHGVCEGVIGITGNPAQVRPYGRLAKKMTEILLQSLEQRRQQLAQERAEMLFIESWLFGENLDWETMVQRGSLLGIDINQPRRVAMVAFPSSETVELQKSSLLEMLAFDFKDQREIICTAINQKILLLFAGREMVRAENILHRVIQEAAYREIGTVKAGLSTVSQGAQDLRRKYFEAKSALRSARPGRLQIYSSASPEFVLQSIPLKLRQDVIRTVVPSLSPEEKEELIMGLRLYFENDGQIELAAANANIHPNTLRYRMGKLTRLTGYDLRRPKDAVMLYMVLQFLTEEA